MELGKGPVLVIANPAAKSGEGAAAAERALHLLSQALGEGCVSLQRTSGPGHAVQLAYDAAASCASVVALGGDGVIHEVAGGLMRLPVHERPLFGVVPVGTGNDYARTLGMSTDVDTAVAQLLAAQARPTDVGEVNGEYFVETLSFGLDAAIALETMERRRHSNKTEGALYFEAGLNQLLHHFRSYHVRAVLDGARTFEVDSITFAVQIGPTYGGGFRICPDAVPDDGVFDICYSKAPVSVPHAVYVFARAKRGKHVGDRHIFFERARSLELSFDCEPPAQADGERVVGSTFDIQMHRHALRVLFGF